MHIVITRTSSKQTRVLKLKHIDGNRVVIPTVVPWSCHWNLPFGGSLWDVEQTSSKSKYIPTISAFSFHRCQV